MKWLVSFAVAVTLVAQDSRFDIQSRLVLVQVTVTDAKGGMIDGLDAKQFVVLDNGRQQRTTMDPADAGIAPIALVVAVQTSGISNAVIAKVHKIGAMIQPLVTGAGGCAAVVSFSERISWIAECTGDGDRLTAAFENLRPGAAKSARMLDAVYQSIERLRQHPNARRILLLISESRDRGSEAALDKVAMAAQVAGVTVYAATYSAFKTAFTTRSPDTVEPYGPKGPKRPGDVFGTVSGGPPRCGPGACIDPALPPPEQRVDILGGMGELVRLGKTNTAQALTTGTGGTTFPFTRLKGLEEAIQKLGADLHSQYLLSFTPDDSTGGYHRIEVRVSSRDVQVRARPGYWSAQASGQKPQ